MKSAITYLLGSMAFVLLALIPAFLVAARQARKTRQQKELEAFNAEIDMKREQKKARKEAKDR